MSSLKQAITVAAAAHRGQTDKAGVQYIEHPLAVMSRLSGEDEKMVAVLHDTLEDTSVDVKLLRDMGFSEEVLLALVAMTQREDEGYMTYVKRIAGNRLAVRVKLADLLENLREDRIKDPEARDWHQRRSNLYREAFQYLTDVATNYGLEVPGPPLQENLPLVEKALAVIGRLQDETPR